MKTKFVGALLGTCLLAVPAAAATEVAVVEGSFWTPDALNFLDGLPDVNATAIQSYTADSLRPYDFVMHYGNSYFDGNALDAYVSGGGNLIATPWMMWNNYWHDWDASPVDFAHNFANHSELLDVSVSDPDDPYLAGVEFNNGDPVGYEGTSTPRQGAVTPAWWRTDGSVLLSYMDYGQGRSFYINLQYITSDADRAIDYEWGRTLLGNIVLVPSPASLTLLAMGVLVRRRRR